MVIIKHKYYIVFLCFIVVFNSYVMYYLKSKQRACECMNNTRKVLIQYYLATSITCSSFVVLAYFAFNYHTFKRILGIMTYALAPLTVAYIIVLYQYLRILKSKGCGCFNNVHQLAFGLLSTIVAWIMSLNVIVLILGFVGFILLKNE
jgi:hypothetical protein